MVISKGYRPEARGYVIYSPRPRATHEGNKSHNQELKTDQRLIFTLARIPQGMQKYIDEKCLHCSSFFFFNTPCWHWWHSQVPRLFNYVSFSKSHFKLVVRSECQKQPKESEVEPFITQTKAASVAVLQLSFRKTILKLHLAVQTTSKQLTISILHRRSFDRPACLQTKKIPGEGSLEGNSVEE